MRFVQAIVLACVATSATAATITEIPTGLTNPSFGQLTANAAGDFVAVSRTTVFVGNMSGPTIANIYSNADASFVIQDEAVTQMTDTMTVNDFRCESPIFVNVSIPVKTTVEVQATRVALNANGDFILASRTRLFVGNTRTRVITSVYEGESTTEFQRVLINDAGDYLAASFRNVFGGNVLGTAAVTLIADAAGDFSEYSLAPANKQIDTLSGESHLALNSLGQFVAASSQTIYAGSVRAQTTETVLTSRTLNVKQVKLTDAGAFVVATEGKVFAGSL